MPKLTDTQLVMLNAAAQRDDGAVLPLPPSVKAKGAARTKALESLLKNGLIEERPAAHNASVWREIDDRRLTLAITEAGLNAISVEPEEAAEAPSASKTSAPRAGSPAKRSKKPSVGRATPEAKPGTKQALLIDLLTRKEGATIDEAVEATGWQPHTVRGAISGALKKKLGLDVTSEKVVGRGRVYRITGQS